MFSPASATFFGLAGVGLTAAVITALGLGDHGAVTLLVLLAIAAVIAALAVFGVLGADVAPVVPADAGAPQRRPVDSPRSARGGLWPVGMGLAAAVLAVGAAVNAGLVVLGLVVAVVVAFGWLAQTWREHPTWTQAMTDRLNDRFVVPFGLPLSVLLIVGLGVISFSRILLAVSAAAAPFIALAAALLILGACTVVALRGVGRGAVGALAAVGVLLVLASGVVGAVVGPRTIVPEGGPVAEVPKVVATNATAFAVKTLTLPADTKATFEFANEQAGTPHNVGIYDKQGGTELFKGAVIVGPLTTQYTFTTPAPGEYFFQCDVHPNMTGKVIVEPKAASGAPAGGGA